jgi:holo-[acyl-carrier protein] synthase
VIRQTLVVGVDVVRVSDVLESLERFGDRYARRIYTESEIAYCRAASEEVPAERFAARFAAKEAAFKALRPSRTDGVGWRSIEVHRSSEGWCEIVLHGAAAEVARRQGIAELTLSMSHEREYAMASVIGCREQGSSSAERETHVRSSAKLAGRGDHAQSQ